MTKYNYVVVWQKLAKSWFGEKDKKGRDSLRKGRPFYTEAKLFCKYQTADKWRRIEFYKPYPHIYKIVD